MISSVVNVIATSVFYVLLPGTGGREKDGGAGGRVGCKLRDGLDVSTQPVKPSRAEGRPGDGGSHHAPRVAVGRVRRCCRAAAVVAVVTDLPARDSFPERSWRGRIRVNGRRVHLET